MKSRSIKNKGKNFQNWIAERLANIYSATFSNQDETADIKSCTMSDKGVDIIIRNELRQRFNYDIEAKRTENVSLYKWIEQAKANTSGGREWLVVHKKSYTDPVVVMSWDSFEKILRRSNGDQQD